MIWFSLALFAVSFILTALLAPRPEIENARAQELDPDNFPRATEDAPLPLLLGCARVRGPNTLWYGNYRPRPITQKVRTGLFRSTRVTVGHEYFLSLDLGLCLGPAELKTIYIDGEPVDPGTPGAFQENSNFFDCNLGGQRVFSAGGDPDPGNPSNFGDVCFDTAFEFNPRVNNDFDMITDWGLSADEIDSGRLLFSAEYLIEWFSQVVTSGRATLEISMYRTNSFDLDSLIFGPDGPGAQVVVVNFSSSDGETLIRVAPFRIPPAARFFRIVGTWEPVLTLSTVTETRGHRFSVAGPNFVYSEENFDIFEPELFGGREQGGGWVGNVQFYPGTFDQLQDTHIQDSLNDQNIPAYRGLSHLVFRNNNIGESPSLRRIEFLMGSISNELQSSLQGRAFVGSLDINPGEAMYTVMRDPWRGMDIPADKVNIASFRSSAETLITERHGCSLVVSSAQQGKNVLREVLRQIDGVLAENQQGEAELRLIRDDYDPDTLPIFDEDDIIEIRNYSRTSWRDVVTEVKVSFSSRDKDSGRVAIAQNMATLNMLGQRRTSEVSFPFCYDEALANQLAARELSRLSIPLIRFTAIMNRSAFQLSVGDVLKITWPEYGILELIVRVQKVNLGTLDDNRVRVDVLQDRFAASNTVFAPPAASGWVSDRADPVSIAVQEVVEQPYFIGSRLESPVEDGFGAVIPFALRPQEDSTGFTLNSDIETGPLGYFDPSTVAYPVTGLFASNFSAEAGFETGLSAAGFTINTVSGTPVSSTVAEIRVADTGLIYSSGEWMAYEGVIDNADGSFALGNVRRGLMGTQPIAHDIGGRVWFFTPQLAGQGASTGELLENGTIFYKMLDRVGATERSPVVETEQQQTLQDIADRPLRPRNLQIDGSRAQVPFDASADPMLALTWVASNRTADQISFENDAGETPDQAETYDVEVFVDGVQDMALSQAGVSSGVNIDLSSATGQSGEIRVYSRRTVGDLKRSAYYAFYPFLLSVTADATTITADTTTITADKT